MEEESNVTRQSLEEFKQEMRNSCNETKQQVIVIEVKVKETEKKIVEFSGRIGKIIQNICTTLLDPPSSQGQQQKPYCQEQIKTLIEAMASLSKPSL
ncbi:unnamed protein product [Rotaria socialis]|uniref:Uncharacterized protein n=1 Tax=Rotaria socialis TaxID=392032 RepID=A0A820VZZ7_9BILA|nr:unnamed protein product [Rotaria socialis]CAF4509842.1 unnamed protein product [Rotaria socialis]